MTRHEDIPAHTPTGRRNPHRGAWRRAVLALLPAALLLAGCPVPQSPPPGPIRQQSLQTQDGSYHIYVPTYYNATRDWPLVVTLHGTHLWDGPQRQVAEWGSLAEEKGLIVIAPKLASVQGILPVVESMWYKDLAADEGRILAAIEEVCGDYKIDRQAMLLTGFSAGGYPMYYVGLRNPAMFSMMIARDANCSVDMLDSLELPPGAQNLRVLIFWGKEDLLPIQRQSWQAFGWLRRKGFILAERREIRGGHLRRPDVAYEHWAKHMPQRHRRP